MIREMDYNVILAPALTEKSTLLSAYQQIVFLVSIDSHKYAIKKAVEAIFNVKVRYVRTFVRKGKNKRFKGRVGRRKDVKYAYVTLVDGHSIDVMGAVR